MKVTLEIHWRAILRFLIGLILIWAALGKLANLQEFFTTLLAYRLPLPNQFLKLVAIVLPWMELLCGLLLTANFKSNVALSWSIVLFAVFTLCTGQAWLRRLPIACGCLDLSLLGIRPGSTAAEFFESPGFAFVRAIALAAVASFVIWPREKSFT